MTKPDLEALRAHYATTDTSQDLERAELDTTSVDEPMIGVTLRLPAQVLNTARGLARDRESKVTALLRELIETGLAAKVPDDAVISVAELRHLMASARPPEPLPGTAVGLHPARRMRRR